MNLGVSKEVSLPGPLDLEQSSSIAFQHGLRREQQSHLIAAPLGLRREQQ